MERYIKKYSYIDVAVANRCLKNIKEMKKQGKLPRKKLTKLEFNTLYESGLSRIWEYINNNDIAIITAWRNDLIDCKIYKNENDKNRKLVRKEKKARNKELQAVLLKKRYGVTKVRGAYFDLYKSPQEKEIKEDSFFVVNLKKDSNFLKNIVYLGELYCQDSVLLKPQGKSAYLYGTNNYNFPGYHKKIIYPKFKGGIEQEFHSRIHGRPFTFIQEASYLHTFDHSFNISGMYLIDLESRNVIKYLDKNLK